MFGVRFACATCVPEVTSPGSTEMPTLLPMLRMRLKNDAPSLRSVAGSVTKAMDG